MLLQKRSHETVENTIKIKNNNETIDKTVNGYKPSYSDIVTGKMENNAENSIKLNVEWIWTSNNCAKEEKDKMQRILWMFEKKRLSLLNWNNPRG